MTIATITQIVESAAVKMMRIFSGGSYMDLTQGHPVFSPALGRKISVDSLRAGMSLLALSGLLLTVDSVAAVHYPTPVYDLQTDAGRGYFAGVEEVLVSSNQCNYILRHRHQFTETEIGVIKGEIVDKVEAFIGDLDLSPELLTYFKNTEGVLLNKVRAWEQTFGTNLSISRHAVEKVAYLQNRGFSQTSLSILIQAEDIKVLTFAEGFSRRGFPEMSIIAHHNKMLQVKALSPAENFLLFQDNINTLIQAKIGDNYLLTNPDGLFSKINAMNTSGSGNPFLLGGHDFEVAVATHIVNSGRSVRLDEIGLPDVLDDVQMKAYQCKKINGAGANSLGSNAKDAVNQIKPTGVEPAPSGYQKIIKIKIANSSHPHFNSSQESIKSYLQAYNANSGTSSHPGPSGTLNGMDEFHIENGSGQFVINGSEIEL